MRRDEARRGSHYGVDRHFTQLTYLGIYANSVTHEMYCTEQ